MAKFSLELSDGLTDLRRQFEDYTHEPRVLSPEDARALQVACDLLRKLARELENEVSAKRWNQAASVDRLNEARRIMAAVHAPGSNVSFFPVVPRPFHDGRQHGDGGAA